MPLELGVAAVDPDWVRSYTTFEGLIATLRAGYLIHELVHSKNATIMS